jgi:hypothetical protein
LDHFASEIILVAAYLLAQTGSNLAQRPVEWKRVAVQFLCVADTVMPLPNFCANIVQNDQPTENVKRMHIAKTFLFWVKTCFEATTPYIELGFALIHFDMAASSTDTHMASWNVRFFICVDEPCLILSFLCHFLDLFSASSRIAPYCCPQPHQSVFASIARQAFVLPFHGYRLSSPDLKNWCSLPGGPPLGSVIECLCPSCLLDTAQASSNCHNDCIRYCRYLPSTSHPTSQGD